MKVQKQYLCSKTKISIALGYFNMKKFCTITLSPRHSSLQSVTETFILCEFIKRKNINKASLSSLMRNKQNFIVIQKVEFLTLPFVVCVKLFCFLQSRAYHAGVELERLRKRVVSNKSS